MEAAGKAWGLGEFLGCWRDLNPSESAQSASSHTQPPLSSPPPCSAPLIETGGPRHHHIPAWGLQSPTVMKLREDFSAAMETVTGTWLDSGAVICFFNQPRPAAPGAGRCDNSIGVPRLPESGLGPDAWSKLQQPDRFAKWNNYMESELSGLIFPSCASSLCPSRHRLH